MPQPRQRIVFCDCLDCAAQPTTTDIPSSSSPANEAAARQEPPPKCLLVVLAGALAALPQQQQQQQQQQHDGVPATVLDGCRLPHLDRAAAQGNLSLLTLRQASPAGACSELAQLLGAYEECERGAQPSGLAERFKGMQASFASNSSTARELAASCGMQASGVLAPEPSDGASAAALGGGEGGQLLPAAVRGAGRRARHGGLLPGAAGSAAEAAGLPDPAEAARRILLELGVQQADSGLDLLLVHLDADSMAGQQQQQEQAEQQQQPEQQQPEQQQQQQQRAMPIGSAEDSKGSTSSASSASRAAAATAAALGWVDRTLRYLNNSAAFRDAVLLAVVATPGASTLARPPRALLAGGGQPLSPGQRPVAPAAAQEQQARGVSAESSGRRVLRPLQSWQQLAGAPIAVDPLRPLLCLRRLPGVVRRDACSGFSLAECGAGSGGCGLVADRLLPELAYKLGRAPKYGASAASAASAAMRPPRRTACPRRSARPAAPPPRPSPA